MRSAAIVAKPVSPEAWAPFGWVPVADTDPLDGSSNLEFAWGDVHVNRISHRREEVPATSDGLVCEMMFRHQSHTQVLMPLDARCVIAVAPAALPLTSAEESKSVMAFIIEPLQCVVLHRGTWHWGPFPFEDESVELFNVQGLRYREDNDCADLRATGAQMEVRIAE
ncbi:MAG TPA: ureidoglycolate lyase [Acidimicrobiales bacterium]|jgi:ureidoglycolate hydrolase|nr:ureidoglycolate lyase [Acidimicrobiales bacterium]